MGVVADGSSTRLYGSTATPPWTSSWTPSPSRRRRSPGLQPRRRNCHQRPRSSRHQSLDYLLTVAGRPRILVLIGVQPGVLVGGVVGGVGGLHVAALDWGHLLHTIRYVPALLLDVALLVDIVAGDFHVLVHGQGGELGSNVGGSLALDHFALELKLVNLGSLLLGYHLLTDGVALLCFVAVGDPVHQDGRGRTADIQGEYVDPHVTEVGRDHTPSRSDGREWGPTILGLKSGEQAGSFLDEGLVGHLITGNFWRLSSTNRLFVGQESRFGLVGNITLFSRFMAPESGGHHRLVSVTLGKLLEGGRQLNKL